MEPINPKNDRSTQVMFSTSYLERLSCKAKCFLSDLTYFKGKPPPSTNFANPSTAFGGVRSKSVADAILVEVKPHLQSLRQIRVNLQKSVDQAKAGPEINWKLLYCLLRGFHSAGGDPHTSGVTQHRVYASHCPLDTLEAIYSLPSLFCECFQ